MGVLYGRCDLLDRLRAYKVRPVGDQPPDKFETGAKGLKDDDLVAHRFSRAAIER